METKNEFGMYRIMVYRNIYGDVCVRNDPNNSPIFPKASLRETHRPASGDEDLCAEGEQI